MKYDLVLFTRKDCGLCDEMKEIILQVGAHLPLALEEIAVDASTELQEKFGNEVPVLFINGRKAFKYRVMAKELEKRLSRGNIDPSTRATALGRGPSLRIPPRGQ